MLGSSQISVQCDNFFANWFPFRSKTAVLTDERIKVMNEIISGIRVIKMYTWEEPFAKLVADIRRLVLKLSTGVATCKINSMLQPTPIG